MKKNLLTTIALAVSLLAFEACSSDDPTKNEDTNKPPTITSIDLEKTTFALNQVAIIKATVTDPENDSISLSWSLGANNLGSRKQFKHRFTSLGEKEITLKATDAKGNETIKSAKINVVEPDFGCALWGDKLDIIERSETGYYRGNALGSTYFYRGNGYDRYYTFSDSILVYGEHEIPYTPKVLQPAQFAMAWTLYEDELRKLTERFGEPTSLTYSIPPTGDKIEDGFKLLNGAGIEAKFSSSRTKATLTTYKKRERLTVYYKTSFSSVE